MSPIETFLHQFGSAGSCLDPNLRVQHSRQAGFKGQSKVMVLDFFKDFAIYLSEKRVDKTWFFVP